MIQVSDHDTLSDVMDRIRGARGSSVTLEIPDHSPIFLTASDFRTLRDISDKAGVSVSLVTTDTLRLQLASMFGLVEKPGKRTHEASAETDQAIESTPSFHGWRHARARHAERMAGGVPAPEEEDPIAVSRRRRAELYTPVQAERPRGDRSNVGLSEDASHVALSYLDSDPDSERWKLIGRIVAVVLVVAIVLGLVGWYMMPGVTVHASLRQGQISTELLYSITRPGASAPVDAAFSVEGKEVSDTVNFTISIPTTGKQVTPDKTASGSVTLRNASTEAVTIPAGTTLTTASGISVTTNSDADVPAGSPDGSKIGETHVDVTATKPGSAGNLAAGELSGKVPDQPVYFSNRDGAMSGGSDIEVAMVSADDLAAIESQVKGDIRKPVADAWTASLPEGQAILAPSVEATDPTYTINGKEGDKTDTLTLDGSVSATALSYDLDSVKDQAKTYYQKALAEKVPDGYELVANSMALESPKLVSESPDTVEFTMRGVATVRAQFNQSAQDGLAEDIAGTGTDEANGILANVPAIEHFSLERSPSWWPGGMPQSAGRVSIVIDAPGTEEPSALPSPEATQ